MELLTGVLLFVVGVAAGVLIMMARNKWDSGAQQAKQELSRCQLENSQIRQDWQDHLATFKSVATNLNEMSTHINSQIDDAEQLLRKPAKAPAFPFFSQEATQFLQNAEVEKREKAQISDQPLDYSGKASGVFQGQRSGD